MTLEPVKPTFRWEEQHTATAAKHMLIQQGHDALSVTRVELDYLQLQLLPQHMYNSIVTVCVDWFTAGLMHVHMPHTRSCAAAATYICSVLVMSATAVAAAG
jgi:hypothetical protein